MKQENKELFAGIALFAVCSLFFSYVFLTKQGYDDKGMFAKHYKVNANFQDIEGIHVGDSVRVAGVEVGKVVEIELSSAFKSLVHMSILKEVELPSDSAIVVESDGLFGSKYLEILPGAEEDMVGNDGHISYSQDTMRISVILERVVDYAKNKMKQCNECMVKIDGDKK